MNCHYFKMIRSSRLFFFGRKNYNVLQLTQRAALLPKQVYMEFSVIVNKEAVSDEEKMKVSASKSHNQGTYVNNSPIKIEGSEMAYSALKVMLKSGANLNVFGQNGLFRDFIQKLVLYNTSDIIKVLKMLAVTGNRAVPALRPLCDALLYRSHNYTEKECSELLFSLAKLSYKNEPLIKLLSEHLKRQSSFESPKSVSSLIHSMSILKYRDCELLDKLLSSYSIDPSDIDNAVDVLVSLAHLNYRPHAVDIIIKFLSDFEDTDYQQTRTYINFIWACVLLNKHASVPEKHFRKILSRTLHEKLEFDKQDLNVGVHLKMLNIFAGAAEVPSLKEFFPTKPLYQNYVSLQIPLRKNPFLESVKDTLSYILSKNANLETFVDTKAGFYLDFQCTLDSKSSPLLMKTKKSCKLGIVLLNYHDICSDGTLTGLSAFKLNILTSQGYKVLTLSYIDYPINAKLSEKIVYLRNAINSCINGSSDSNGKEENADQKV